MMRRREEDPDRPEERCPECDRRIGAHRGCPTPENPNAPTLPAPRDDAYDRAAGVRLLMLSLGGL